LGFSSTRVLIAEDFEPFRRFLCATLQKIPHLRIVAEVADGLEAIQKAQELQPDLLLLDVGLPGISGIEVVRHTRKISPATKILIVSQESSADVVEEAFRAGAGGYVVKTDARRELLEALNAVLRGAQFVGKRFAGHDFIAADVPVQKAIMPAAPPSTLNRPRRHEAGFYSDDVHLVDGFAEFISSAVAAGNASIVVATASHRQKLVAALRVKGVDVDAAARDGRYISLEAGEILSKFMDNEILDAERLLKITTQLISDAAHAVKQTNGKVFACGEGAPLLCAQGNVDAALRVEQLWDNLAETRDVEVFCGYPMNVFQGTRGRFFEAICEKHTVVHWK
jgi:CheY-like chemotaxis protein